MTVAILLAMFVVVRPRLPRRHRRTEVDGEAAGRLVLLALRAGESIHGALAIAAEESSGPTSAALRRVAHRARMSGLAVALGEADPALVPLLSVLARAGAVGAPIAADLAAHLRDGDRTRHMAAVARARSAPVRLAVPLTLLILPGVVLLSVGPSVLTTFTDVFVPGGLLP